MTEFGSKWEVFIVFTSERGIQEGMILSLQKAPHILTDLY